MTSLLLDCIRRHISRFHQSDLDPAVVDLDATFVDLGYDSYGFVELVIIVEETFAIEFADEDLNYRRFNRVADLLTYVERRVAATVDAS